MQFYIIHPQIWYGRKWLVRQLGSVIHFTTSGLLPQTNRLPTSFWGYGSPNLPFSSSTTSRRKMSKSPENSVWKKWLVYHLGSTLPLWDSCRNWIFGRLISEILSGALIWWVIILVHQNTQQELEMESGYSYVMCFRIAHFVKLFSLQGVGEKISTDECFDVRPVNRLSRPNLEDWR